METLPEAPTTFFDTENLGSRTSDELGALPLAEEGGCEALSSRWEGEYRENHDFR